MMWPASQASKLLSALLLALVLYCILMDTFFFFRIQYYKIDTFASNSSEELGRNGSERTATTAGFRPLASDRCAVYEYVTWVPCTFNPLCHPTVKGLMVDHVNHYMYGPLCALVDVALGISSGMPFVTPNAISFFHVGVAVVGGRLLTGPSLAARRLGIVLFQLRMFLDDLDGHVARERRHVKGERSDVGTQGYYVDGVCDLLGVVAMMLGVACYLRGNPPRRGYRGVALASLPYHQLGELASSSAAADDADKDAEAGIMYKTKVPFGRIARVILLFSGQMLLSSLAWNRYIDIYQRSLESGGGGGDWELIARQERVFRSGAFFSATGLWRVVNPHSYLHLLSLAIFCDKTWPLLRSVQYGGYVCLIVAVFFSEYLANNVNSYIVTR